MTLLIALLLAQPIEPVRVCDRLSPSRCMVVNPDGTINISGTISVSGTSDAVSSGAPTTFGANAVCTGQLLLAGEQGAGFQLNSGTLAATLTPQYSLEASGSNWTTTQFIDQNGSKTATLVVTNPNSLFQQGIVLVTGARRAQVCTTAYTSGSATGLAVAAFVQGGAAASGGGSGLTDAQLRASPVPVSTASLPLPAGAATEATLLNVKTGTDKIPASPSQEHATAGSPSSARLSDGAAFYDATKTGQLPAALDGSGNLKTHEQGTAAISAVALPLPAGASTEATLALIKTDVDKIPASPSTDRTAAASPFSVRLGDGAAFYDARSIRLLTSSDVVDVSDRAGRALGTIANTSFNVGNFPSTYDTSDRAARLLGVVYGSQAQQLKQTATNFNLAVESFVAGSAIDPRSIRLLTSGDVVSAAQSGTWTVQPGNTANTTAWLVTGTGGTFPITATSLPLATGAASDATVAETHAVTLGSIPTRQEMIAGSDYGYSCNGGACSQVPRIDANGYQYTAITSAVRVQGTAQPLNPLLPRCNAVRRLNCQP